MKKLKQNESLVYYLLSRASSVLGLQIVACAIVFRALELNIGLWGIGQLGLVATVSSLLTSIPLGQLVDRLPRKRAITISYVAVSLFTLIIACLGSLSYGMLLLVSAVAATLRNFRSIAQFSVFGDLIKEKRNAGPWINASTLSWQIAACIAPILAGIAARASELRSDILTSGSQVCFAVATGLLLLALGCMARVRISPSTPKAKAPLSELVSFFAENRKIRASLILDFIVVLFSGATAVLPFLQSSFSDPLHLGLLRSAMPSGVILGTLFILNRSLTHAWAKSLVLATIGYGLAHLLISVTGSFLVTYGLLMIAGFFDAISLSVRENLLQQETPAALKGRVYSLNGFIVNASDELSEWESGLATQYMGVAASLRLGAGVTFLTSGYFAYRLGLIGSSSRDAHKANHLPSHPDEILAPDYLHTPIVLDRLSPSI